MILIQANIAGYQGKPCSLFSSYESDTQILSVVADSDYKKQRREECVLISNDKNGDYDGLFSEAYFASAINDFFALLNGVAFDGRSSRITFHEKIARANPKSAIEKDGYTENGQKFRISEGITNLQIAVLATCFYANSRSEAIENTLTMFDQLNNFNSLTGGQDMIGGVFTI